MKNLYLLTLLSLSSIFAYGQKKSVDLPRNTSTEFSNDVPGSVTVTPNLQGLSGKATCTYTGTLVAGDNQMSKRLFRDAIGSTCATNKTYPGDFTATVYYKTISIPNNTGAAQCVTITPTVSEATQVHFTAYLGSFDPNNLATNYRGDSGSSSNSSNTYPFEIQVPAGQTLVIVANTVSTGDVMTGTYSIQVTGLNCLPVNCVKDIPVTSSQPSMANRLFRDGVPSVCGTTKAYPGSIAQTVFYNAPKITNNTGVTQCITVSGAIHPDDAAITGGVHLTAYNGSFNPTNIATNYLADSGTSATTATPQGLGVTVAAGNSVVLVISTNYAGDSFSKPITITVEGVDCSAILATDEANNNTVKNTVIYPNPTDAILNVKGIQMKSVKVFDQSGKIVSVKSDQNTIDTRSLVKGVYSLQITDVEGNIILERFIKK